VTLKIFSIFDIKSEVFSHPFFMTSNGEAVRAFKDLANDRETVVGRHPSDFRLMCLGAFDNVTGEFSESVEHMASLGFGSDYVNIGGVPVGVSPIKAVS
jgi:hypothetical protein